MKKYFPGFIKKSEKEIKDLWKNGMLCFDANILLNLYRYSESTQEEILNLIEKFQEIIWLPNQSALEYNRNRYEVIATQEKTYKEFTSKINQIENDLKSSSKPPFLSKKIHQALKKVFSDVNKEVADSINKYSGFLQEDKIYDRISEIFSGKISEPFSQEELDEIYSEGKKRYELKKPPGYEDEKNKNGIRKFGDLVLWKQIINKAKEIKRPMILITDERKGDWWWKIKDGRNMGPRQELIEEMRMEAKVDFHMYSSERFLSFGFEYIEEQINDKTLKEILNEINELTKSEQIRMKRTKFSSDRLMMDKQALNELDHLTQKINEIKTRKESIQHGLNIYKEEPIGNPENKEQLIDLSFQVQLLEQKQNELISSRMDLLKKIESKHIYRRKFDY